MKPTSIDYRDKDLSDELHVGQRVTEQMDVRDQLEWLWFKWRFDKTAPDYAERLAARDALIEAFDAAFGLTREDQLRSVRAEASRRGAVVLDGPEYAALHQPTSETAKRGNQ
jgi:hypothetical protein